MIVVSKDELKDKWWVCYNEDKSIVHHGITESPQQTETGLSLFQVFDTESEWLNILENDFNIVLE
ncbi:MAG: hypothetical protein ACOVK2_02035 [Candidatus Fonsibacter sp.]